MVAHTTIGPNDPSVANRIDLLIAKTETFENLIADDAIKASADNKATGELLHPKSPANAIKLVDDPI